MLAITATRTMAESEPSALNAANRAEQLCLSQRSLRHEQEGRKEEEKERTQQGMWRRDR